MADPPELEQLRRRGRRVGIAIFALIVAGCTLVWTAQIVRQVWFVPAGASERDCREGLLALIGAVKRARSAAGREIHGERAAVARFRAALDPEWADRDALANTCSGDARGLRALKEVDRYRYAEEHAARYESVDLARRRRAVERLREELTQAN